MSRILDLIIEYQENNRLVFRLSPTKNAVNDPIYSAPATVEEGEVRFYSFIWR